MSNLVAHAFDVRLDVLVRETVKASHAADATPRTHVDVYREAMDRTARIFTAAANDLNPAQVYNTMLASVEKHIAMRIAQGMTHAEVVLSMMSSVFSLTSPAGLARTAEYMKRYATMDQIKPQQAREQIEGDSNLYM